MAGTTETFTDDAYPEDTVPPGRPEQFDALGSADIDCTGQPDAVAEQLLISEVSSIPPDLVEIFWDNRSALIGLAGLIVRGNQLTEDIVSDALEGVARRYGAYDPALTLPYLKQAVVHRSLRALKHGKVVERAAPLLVSREYDSTQELAFENLDRTAVQSAIEELTPQQQAVIKLRYYKDMSEADIADTMGISRGSVKSHSSRAMSKLRTLLSGIIHVVD